MAAHVVVFSELTPRARVQYTRFLLDSHVHFARRESDGRFVANVRLMCSRDKEPGSPARVQEASSPQLVDSIAHSEGDSIAVEAWIEPRYRRLSNLVELCKKREVKTSMGVKSGRYVKETRLVRQINDIYDALRDDVGSTLDGGPTATFARSVRHYLTNRFGLRKMVDQQCWELVDGLTNLSHRLDVELFTCFVEGKYAAPVLAFFLDARSKVQGLLSSANYRPTLHKTSSSAKHSAKRSVASLLANPAPIWLSRVQLETLAPLVFGTKTEDLFIEFSQAVHAFLSSAGTRSVDRVLHVSEFLVLAVETYHKSAGCMDSRQIFIAEDANGSMTPRSDSSVISSTGAVVAIDDTNKDDMQSRLDSLLERAKLRQQQRSFGV